MGYVHGIHNSHNMPGAVDTSGVPVPGGVYYRNGGATSTFSIGFPGAMNNCSTCHLASALPTLANVPVSWRNCMSCHIGPPTLAGTQTVAAGWAWAGFGVANTGTAAAPIFSFGGVNHAGFDSTTTCSTCHNGTVAPATIAGFHNGLLTDRSGLLWEGADQAVELGATVDMQITGVTVNGNNLEVTWTTTVGGTPVDPCNQDYNLGPVFFGKSGITASPCNNTPAGCNSNLSILRAYAQANDWVNAGLGTAPGQPASAVNVVATGTGAVTTCVSNVATSVLPVGTTFGTKGVVALQGKPQMIFTGTGNVIQVRARTPTREFVVGTGAAPAASELRRDVVDTAKCNSCHKGTLYQHGGNRVDNVALCAMCHNPAANENNNRVNMGVTSAEAYDGKAGETYEFRTMIHAIHSSGETGQPLVYYRTNGIYFFGSKDALAEVTSWPGTGCQIVAGSGAPSSATGTQCDPANTTQVTKNHNFIEVRFPRTLKNCYACHADTWTPSTVDPTRAVAVTFLPGASITDQLDDVLMGPNAASCMSCHQSGDPAIQFGLRIHAYGQGWVPTTFPNGRQTLLDAASMLP
jgi:OmcA/MtrC family decaheme c-type cytochrome